MTSMFSVLHFLRPQSLYLSRMTDQGALDVVEYIEIACPRENSYS